MSAVETARVSVVKYGDRPNLVLRWRDPATNQVRCKSAGTSRRRDAQRAAAKLEREIAEGKHGPNSRMSWPEFRDYHETHCLKALADKTFDAYACALNVFERFANPSKLPDIKSATITAWQTHLRTEGKSEATIATYTRHLRAILRWARSQGLLASVPKLEMPKRAKQSKVMKGRPITAEEFDRLLAAVPKVVCIESRSRLTAAVLKFCRLRDSATHSAAVESGLIDTISGLRKQVAQVVESWRHYLRGLWWSGLRLEESLKLEWQTNSPGALVVDLAGRRPMLRIPAESEKGGQDRVLPMAPEFAEFLQETPEARRVGRVFKLVGSRWADARMQADWVSRVVCRIGRKARVVVDQRERRLVVDARRAAAKPGKAEADPGDGIKRKYASAHDLRRAFGLRWSARVMPAVLQQLMRHESIETTMKYYVGRDADAVADVLWSAVENQKGNVQGNIGMSAESDGAKKKPQTLAGSRLLSRADKI